MSICAFKRHAKQLRAFHSFYKISVFLFACERDDARSQHQREGNAQSAVRDGVRAAAFGIQAVLVRFQGAFRRRQFGRGSNLLFLRVGQRIVRRAGGFDRRFGRIVVFRGDFCGQRVDLRVDCLRRFLFGLFFFICGERAFRRRQFRIRSYQSACVLAQRVVCRSRGDDRRLRRRVIFGVDARGQGF